ncbi:phasin family protein [Microvirga pudoricolor]|uniref:phasin family protein n=1 Tax=Microvirga pudoricolor TaxID=2778729 RepID=UPI00194DFBD5|nr:phasin family protein [Microvirga pudoricolor]MBM6596562.1 phasin family protein [Microvirga pudoricolor]
MAETKKSSSNRSVKRAMPAKAATPAADLLASDVQNTMLEAAEPVMPATVQAVVQAVKPEAMLDAVHMVAEATPQVMRHVAKRTEESREVLRAAMQEAATASTRGALEVNDKMIEAFRAQSDAAFDLWQSTLRAGSLPEAVQLQTAGLRNAYETATAQWQDIAATTKRWFGQSVEPIQAVWTNR